MTASTTPRRSAKKKPVDDIPMPEIEVMDLRSEDMDTEPDMVEIFRLDGKPYYFDRNIGAGVTLRILKALRVEGENGAVVAMLMELLGEEQYDALANFRGIRAQHLSQVLLSCHKAILGDGQAGPKA